jgi:hypothetical protein
MLKDLCAQTCVLRKTILRRVAALGVAVDDVPDAAAIVDGRIGAFLFGSEYAGARRKLTEGRAGESGVVTLLVLECFAAIEAACGGRGETTEAA